MKIITSKPMQSILLTNATGPLWQAAMSLYCDTFPQWEREPISDIAEAINTGHTRCVLLHENHQVRGVSLTELYPQQSFALLGYLFISPTHQGLGLGKQLCQALFEYFRLQNDYKWLFVEAESGPEQFYQKIGFAPLNVDYWSPHYSDEKSTPMALMCHTQPTQLAPSPQELYQVVEHIFFKSYYLSPDDPRLAQQRDRIIKGNI